MGRLLAECTVINAFKPGNGCFTIEPHITGACGVEIISYLDDSAKVEPEFGNIDMSPYGITAIYGIHVASSTEMFMVVRYISGSTNEIRLMEFYFDPSQYGGIDEASLTLYRYIVIAPTTIYHLAGHGNEKVGTLAISTSGGTMLVDTVTLTVTYTGGSALFYDEGHVLVGKWNDGPASTCDTPGSTQLDMYKVKIMDKYGTITEVEDAANQLYVTYPLDDLVFKYGNLTVHGWNTGDSFTTWQLDGVDDVYPYYFNVWYCMYATKGTIAWQPAEAASSNFMHDGDYYGYTRINVDGSRTTVFRSADGTGGDIEGSSHTSDEDTSLARGVCVVVSENDALIVQNKLY